jgi:hypothetical protein
MRTVSIFTFFNDYCAVGYEGEPKIYCHKKDIERTKRCFYKFFGLLRPEFKNRYVAHRKLVIEER